MIMMSSSSGPRDDVYDDFKTSKITETIATMIISMILRLQMILFDNSKTTRMICNQSDSLRTTAAKKISTNQFRQVPARIHLIRKRVYNVTIAG